MKFKTTGHGHRQRWYVDGQEVSQEVHDKLMQSEREALPKVDDGDCSSLFGWKPLLSDAMAVHPEQIPEAEEDARAKGVPTEFEPKYGRPLFTSRSHRRAYMDAYGCHDNDGGYGD